jgi:hypothetical protein
MENSRLVRGKVSIRLYWKKQTNKQKAQVVEALSSTPSTAKIIIIQKKELTQWIKIDKNNNYRQTDSKMVYFRTFQLYNGTKSTCIR